jgi:WD40 repeat protein/DNA-binding SARP family transcriptional activator
MVIRLLGPLEVGSPPVTLGGAKQRAVLAMLALQANRTVSADRLMEGLWGEELPRSAPKMVQHYVSRLRRALAGGPARIATRGRGYQLCVDADSVDALLLEKLVAEAIDGSAPSSRPAREALALWRGPALADLADEPFAAAEIRRLEELRLLASEAAVEDDLAAGRHREVLAEIERLVAAEPLRERLHEQRMLALYRCGRQGDALEAYSHARRVLVDAIGVEPGPGLRRLHDAILRQDPALERRTPARPLPGELDLTGAPALVGRRGELEALEKCWRRARAGAGSLVAVLGADGMGRTRLVAELARAVRRDGATISYASGDAAAGQAVTDVVRAGRRALLVLDDMGDADALAPLAGSLASAPVLAVVTASGPAVLDGIEPAVTLTLAPLTLEDVGRLAAACVPADAVGDLPLQELSASSGGSPARVIELAGAWARRRAQQRVSASAGRAAAGRAQLRSEEAALTSDVVALQDARERELGLTSAHARADAGSVCPFKGLASYDVDDAPFFCGRERLVAELVALLVGNRLVGVVGSSGSGKSSLVRAGLLGALRAGVLPGSETWRQVLLRPGPHPRAALRRASAGTDPARRCVIVVDQFEEVFTACDDEAERAAFVADLIAAAQDPAGGATVVIAVRADFAGRCAAYTGLDRLLGANQLLVGPLRRDELRRAIERPAQRAGLRVEPALCDALVADTEHEPGGLPLLSSALLELWRERDGRDLRLAAYERAGGVRGAVARLAEDAFEGLDPERQGIARDVLLRLAGIGEGGAAVRRRVALRDLRADAPGPVADVVATLAGRRLLSIGDGSVEVAHEALLREWPRLVAWLDDDAASRRLRRHLAQAAIEWEQGGRDPADLYRGARLAAAVEWAGTHPDELQAGERDFLAAGKSAGGRAQRRLRAVAGGMAVLLVGAVVAGLLALEQRGAAREEAAVAEAQRLGAQALTVKELDRSLLLARQGVALHDSVATRSDLLGALLRSPAAVGAFNGDGDPLLSADLSPDGRILALGDSAGTLRVFDTTTRRQVLRPYQVDGSFLAVRFSPDGRKLAVSNAGSGGGYVDVLDARTRDLVTRLEGFDGLSRSVGRAELIAFSPDSRTIVVPVLGSDSGLSDSGLGRWDVESGKLLQGPVAVDPARLSLLEITTRGRLVAVEGDRLVVRDAASLLPTRQFAVPRAAAGALSPDGRLAALGGSDGTVRLVDLATGRVRATRVRHDAAVTALRFGPGGRRLLSADAGGAVIAWDSRRAAVAERMDGHAGSVRALAISPDGHTGYSAGTDGAAIAWDLAGTRRFGLPVDAGALAGEAPLVAAAAAASVVAVVQRDGAIAISDSRTLRGRLRIAPAGSHPPTGIDVAPGGSILAATALDGSVRLWDLPTGKPLGDPIQAHTGPAGAPSLSADGRWLATASIDVAPSVGVSAPSAERTVALIDVRRRRLVRSASVNPPGQLSFRFLRDVRLSPDGRALVVLTASESLDEGLRDGNLDVLSVPDLEPLRGRSDPDAPPATEGAFSADGRVFVFADHQGRAWIYDAATWKHRGGALSGHSGMVVSADVSPDGALVATTGTDGAARLWDVASGRALGAPLPAPSAGPAVARFTRGGTHLLVLSSRGSGREWDVRPASWARQACAVAGRRLTRAEWQEALPGRSYAPACGDG